MLKRLAAMAAGMMLVLTAGAAMAQTVSTPTPSNNGDAGIMFDVTATNAVTVTGLANQFNTAIPQTVNIYTRPGTHVGFSSASTGWSLVGTTSLTGTGAVQSIPVVLSEPIAAGQTKGFYIAAAGIGYRNGTAVGAVAASDANIQILEGTGKSAPDFSATNNTPRVLVGSVTYSAGPAPVPTLSEWAMILFGLALAGGAALYIQRRRMTA
ncbi:IPTL-CTERM sorting domain-containing protein [Brevundimonas sp. TWP2-3-4b1]|uniref:IPTL-CTERM sorting domain-containing protein n=1 Tax=Brevundimonas sp. TWP2-3-4b1 TaxID=2804580 RepID=UPI003CF162F0